MRKLLSIFALLMVSTVTYGQALYKLNPLRAETSYNRKEDFFVFEFTAINLTKSEKEFEPFFKFPLLEENELNNKSDLSKYLVNKKIKLKLKGGESKQVKLEFKIPSGITGSLYLRYGLREVNAASNGVRFKIGEVGLMGVTLSGTVKQKLELVESKYTPAKGQLTANYTFKNVGNSYIKKLKGEVSIISNGKVLFKKEVLAADDLFFPQGSIKKMNLFARHKVAAGTYDAKLVLSDNEGTFVDIIPLKITLK